MLQQLRCVRFGEVLVDERCRTFLYCTNCHSEYADLQAFGAHLRSSSCGGSMFKENALKLKWPTHRKVCYKSSSAKGNKQYLVYNVKEVSTLTSTKAAPETGNATASAVKHNNTNNNKLRKDDGILDLMKIEEELLDPRWYDDITPAAEEPPPTSTPNTKTMAYNELVEAVTPYVQFKENVNKHATPNATKPKNAQTAQKVNQPAPPVVVKRNTSTQASIAQASKQSVNSKSSMVINPAAKRRIINTTTNVNGATQLPTAALTPPKESQTVTKQYVVKFANNQIVATEQPVAKRRKTMTIPMEQVQIQPEFQQQFGAKTTPTQGSIPTATKTTAMETKVPTRQLGGTTKNTMAPLPAPAAPPPTTVQKPSKVMGPPAVKASAKPVTNMSSSSNAPQPIVKQTEQILTKLQTLGLQIKRTQPAANAGNAKIDETLELLKKLQSKGMKVKVVNKDGQTHATAAAANATGAPILPIKTSPPGGRAVATNGKTTLNRNLIIKKVK